MRDASKHLMDRARVPQRRPQDERAPLVRHLPQQAQRAGQLAPFAGATISAVPVARGAKPRRARTGGVAAVAVKKGAIARSRGSAAVPVARGAVPVARGAKLDPALPDHSAPRRPRRCQVQVNAGAPATCPDVQTMLQRRPRQLLKEEAEAIHTPRRQAKPAKPSQAGWRSK